MSLLPSTEGTLETKGVVGVGRVAIWYPESSGFLATRLDESSRAFCAPALLRTQSC